MSVLAGGWYSLGGVLDNLVVVDFAKKTRKEIEKTELSNSAKSEGSVVCIEKERKQRTMKDRRKAKRVILTEYFSAYVQVPNKGLQEVVLYDLSKKGLAFDMSQESGCFNKNEIIRIRIYLNNYTYFPFNTKVAHTRHVEKEGVYRVGTEFLINKWNRYPLNSFVDFVKSINSEIKIDVGDMVINYR